MSITLLAAACKVVRAYPRSFTGPIGSIARRRPSAVSTPGLSSSVLVGMALVT